MGSVQKRKTIRLVRAGIHDAETIWKMQIEAFAELLERYQDLDTSPANEPLEKTVYRLRQPSTYFYFILADEETAGAIRVVDEKNGNSKRISPVFVMSRYRNQGIAQGAILCAEAIHGADGWELDTILQEKGNCYLYEKMGYVRTGRIDEVNDRMSLVCYRK